LAGVSSSEPGARVGELGGGGLIVRGGAAVGLVGWLVGKLGSVPDGGPPTGLPAVVLWQPARIATDTRTQAGAVRAITGQGYAAAARSRWCRAARLLQEGRIRAQEQPWRRTVKESRGLGGRQHLQRDRFAELSTRFDREQRVGDF
jgi:hypothetical protein